MQFDINAFPDEGDVFHKTCFDSNIGKIIPIKDVNGVTSQGMVVAVRVADDGKSADITIEIDNPNLQALGGVNVSSN